jgi:DNA primase small subunit
MPENKMPHAESPNPPSSPPVDDTVMEEAVSGALDEQAESQNETTQSSPAPAVNEADKASLEDIFDDDDMDDDDEFSSSAQNKIQASSQPEP